MQPSSPEPFTWVNEDTVSIPFGAPDDPAAATRAGMFVDAVRQLDGVLDAYSGFGQAMVTLSPPFDLTAIESCMARQLSVPPAPHPLLRVPVCYHPDVAPDQASAAEALGLSVQALVTAHTGCALTVMAMGFAPGFGYLGGLPAHLRLPRKATPRASVPAGSVAIAERQSVIYPTETPGGWHLIGRSPVTLMQYQPAPWSLFQIGQAVQFYPISLADFHAWTPDVADC